MRDCFFSILFICIFSVGFAQKVVKVCGEYTYYVPNNVSLEQAKQTAINRARLEALIKEFNQTVYQSNTSIISNKNGEASSDFYSYGGSEANGEWIEDTKEPTINTFTEQNQIVIKAEVCGRARERKSSGVDFSSKLLRNGTNDKFASDTFVEDDYLYLSFSSASDGYLCVYLLDRETQEVFCLLPYSNSPNGAVKVEHDKRYVFFDPDDRNQPECQYIDGNIYLTCSREIEYNEVYVIFSPNNFSKANGSKIKGEHLPRELSFKDFQKWLVSCQTKDKDMKVTKHLIEIKRK